MVDAVTIEISNESAFKQRLHEISKKVNDLTIPLTLISQSWFKSNRAIFSLKGPGKYEDLSPKYKLFKTKTFGSPYPILKLSGSLEKSITEPTDHRAISEIVNKKVLLLGSRVTSKDGAPYAIFLHNGTSRGMPARPVVLLGSEQSAPSGLNKRVNGFIQI